MKKTAIALAMLLGGVAYANNYVSVVGTDAFKVTDTKVIEYTEWVNSGIGYNCDAWFPEADTIDKGVEFTQERTCDQDQERDKNTYFVDIDGNKTLSKTEKEYKTIESTEEQQATGTYDILGFIYLLRSQHDTS